MYQVSRHCACAAAPKLSRGSHHSVCVEHRSAGERSAVLCEKQRCEPVHSEFLQLHYKVKSRPTAFPHAHTANHTGARNLRLLVVAQTQQKRLLRTRTHTHTHKPMEKPNARTGTLFRSTSREFLFIYQSTCVVTFGGASAVVLSCAYCP